MKTFSTTLPAALALTLIAAPALAAELTANQKSATRDVETSDGDLRLGRAAPGFQLTADGDATSAAFTYGRDWQGRDTATKPGDVQSLSFKVSAPVNQDTGEGNFLTADGRFSSGVSLGFSYTRMILPNPPLPGTAAEREEVAALTIAALHKLNLQACLEPGSKTPCLTYGELVDLGAVPANENLVDHAFLDGEIWQWGVSAEVARPSFDYRDPTTLAKQSERHTVVSASLNGGLRMKGGVYFGGVVTYENGREEASKRTLCHATATAGITECFTSPYAAPERDEATTVMAVARWRSRDADNPYAVEIKAGYDSQSQLYGVATSLYLAPDAKGALRGGLRLAWQSDDDDPTTDAVTFGVFIGAPF